jgi:hypothetical protein
VSVRGAFVLARVCPPVGATVGLTASIPTYSDLTGVLRIAGRVIRVEESTSEGADSGFAVSGNKIIFAESSRDGGEPS